MKFKCAQCGKETSRSAGHVNRSRKAGNNLYCGRACSGLGRRKNLTVEQKKANKRQYDIGYREKNKAKIKAQKAAAFRSNYYDPNHPLSKKLAEYRKVRQPKHNEYCRQPGYKAKKHKYDRKRYAQDKFGPLWEIHVLAMELTEEAQSQMTKFEIMQSKGTINKAQKRKREYEKTQRS